MIDSNRIPTNWSFHNPTHVFFGPGSSGLISAGDYKKIVVVTTEGFVKREVVGKIKEALRNNVIDIYTRVKSNPTIDDIDSACASIHSINPDCLIAIGGGSCIDTAKAVARMLEIKSTSIEDLLIGKTELSKVKYIPVIAVPTTAGTGSEVTPFATIWDRATMRKYSLASPRLFPKMAYVDPNLTVTQFEEQTVATGLDAISHALESVWNVNASPATLRISAASLNLSLQALIKVQERGNDLKARSLMMEASLLAGLAISQTRTAIGHSISYPLTLKYSLPHGISCSFALPAILEFNFLADDGRIEWLSKSVGYDSVEGLKNRLFILLLRMGVPKIMNKYIKDVDEVIELAPEMLSPSRAENNLRTTNIEDIKDILRKTFLMLNIY